MKTFIKVTALVLAFVMCAVVFTACGTKNDETVDTKAVDTAAADTAEKADGDDDTLVMATNASFPPYEFVGENGDYAGIDVEIAGKIAEKLGKTLKIVDTEFGSIIGGVQSGKYDMGMAGMTVTDERKESVDFSDTYATGVQVVIVPEGSEITSTDDFMDGENVKEGLIIGVQQDTTGDIYASGDFGEDHIVRYKTGNDAVQALVAGKVAAVIIDNEPAKSYVAANEGLKILETAYVTEDYAICVSKDNTDLLDAINSALNELIDDGVVAEIIAKYIPAE